MMNGEGRMDSRKRAAAQTQLTKHEAGTEQVARVKYGIRLKFSLTIISLVVTIIISITLIFIWRETSILNNQAKQMWDRETVHLASTAQNIGVLEIPINEAINDLKTFEYIKYAYVLDRKNIIQAQYFDRRRVPRGGIGSVFNDKINRHLAVRNEREEHVQLLKVPDPNEPGGEIWDFSQTVLDKLAGKKLGTVIIGMSDIVISKEIWNLKLIILGISLGFLVISIAGAVVLATVTIRPVKALYRGAEIIGRGNLDYRIEIKTRDELGQLANEFNLMTAKIKEAKEKEIASRIMEEQLEMAKDIQEGMNPMAFYNKNGIQIKGYTKAKESVGGDYFDYIDIDQDKVGALISDVSGKGIPASLIMVMIRTVFTSYISRKDVSCAGVVRAINDAMSLELAFDRFATMFFMIYDRKTEELSFSNAGYGPLLCYRSSMRACTHTQLEGVPIGIDEEYEYKQARVKLNPGDLVVLCTDGVTEMRNAQQQEYGQKRLQNLLVNNYELDADKFVELLVQDVEKFRGSEPPHDDTTVLVLKRTA
jgi:serine phosphatase RsbU (regulator of sigma subunit)